MASRRGPTVGRRLGLVPQLDPAVAGEAFDGLGERERLDLHQEPDRVAVLAAAEAVEHLLGRGHAERGGLLGVERADAGERVVPGLLEGEVVPDQLDDVGPVADLLDVLLLDPPGHAGSFGAATGASPGEGRAARTSGGRTGPSSRRCSRRCGWACPPGPDGTPRGSRPDGPGSTRTATAGATRPCAARRRPCRAGRPAGT